MQNYTFKRPASREAHRLSLVSRRQLHEHTWLNAPLLAAALLAATLAVGCEEPEDTLCGVDACVVDPSVIGSSQDGGSAQQPPPLNPQNPLDGAPGQNPNPALGDGGDGGVGGSLDTQWCKVKKIIDTKCVACHTTPLAAGAPFPLLEHEDLTAAHPSKAGKKIYERVGVRVHADQSQAEGLPVMPPGSPLPADQLALIDAWVAAGAPAGENPTCTPPAGSGNDAGAAAEVWPLPECDAVYKVTSNGGGNTPYSVPPKQEIHPQISIPAPWGNEKVQAIAFKTITDNKAVLHHWILNGGGAFLTGWAPGEDGIKKMGPDIGMNMPTGNLTLDMHYNSLQLSTTEKDASGVEICVVKEPNFRKNHAAVTMRLLAIPNIPNNAVSMEMKGTCKVSGNTPVTLLSASPHAHTLAVRMLFTVKKKNGQTITLHDMPFMFGEQKSYPLDPPVVVEAGDVINTSCFFTNKTGKTVTFGEDTGNEMCFNFASYYPMGALSCSVNDVLDDILGR